MLECCSSRRHADNAAPRARRSASRCTWRSLAPSSPGQFRETLIIRKASDGLRPIRAAETTRRTRARPLGADQRDADDSNGRRHPPHRPTDDRAQGSAADRHGRNHRRRQRRDWRREQRAGASFGDKYGVEQGSDNRDWSVHELLMHVRHTGETALSRGATSAGVDGTCSCSSPWTPPVASTWPASRCRSRRTSSSRARSATRWAAFGFSPREVGGHHVSGLGSDAFRVSHHSLTSRDEDTDNDKRPDAAMRPAFLSSTLRYS